MGAHRAILALSLFPIFGLSNAAFAQQHFDTAATAVVLARSSEAERQNYGTRPSTNIAATPEKNVWHTIAPPGTVDDTQPVINRTATGRPRRLGSDQPEQGTVNSDPTGD